MILLRKLFAAGELRNSMPVEIDIPEVGCTLTKVEVGKISKFFLGSRYNSSLDYTISIDHKNVGQIELVEDQETDGEIRIANLFEEDMLEKKYWKTHFTPILKALIRELKKTRLYKIFYFNPMNKILEECSLKAGFKPKIPKDKYEDLAVVAKL